MRTWPILLTLSALSLSSRAQTAHVVRGLDFYYDPDTVYMLAGDSVKFQTQGIHDMVQTDSAAWAINQAISNGGFVTNIGLDTTFVIDTAGTYYFVCSPHGFVGMKGVLLVDSTFSTGLPERRAEATVQLVPNPAQAHVQVTCTHPQAAWVELCAITGERLRAAVALDQGRADLDLSGIVTGQHVLRVLDLGRRPLVARPLLIVR